MTLRIPEDLAILLDRAATRHRTANTAYVLQALSYRLGQDNCRDDIEELRRRVDRLELDWDRKPRK